MSYTPMMNSNLPRGSYVPEYDNNTYKIPPANYNPYPPSSQQLYPPSNSNSIALFHIPADGTNSLYVDGVPNDTN